MSSLTAIFGNSAEKSEDSDKLMELYWNRAELKKEFARMRKDRYRLEDRIKEQEGKTARIQQQLDHLEGLLTDPDWAHNVVVFYQLRNLGRRAERKLARFAEQLKQQREQKKHNSLLGDWNEARRKEAAGIDAAIISKREQIEVLEGELGAEQRRLAQMNAFIRLFRGRSAMKLIDGLARRLEEAMSEEGALQDELKALENRKPPDHQGLDIAAKRSINLMILAFAQQLYIQLDQDGIARLVKESTEKSVGAINYGTPYECDQLLEAIRSGSEKIDHAADFADILKRRAIKLGETARFPGKADAVPIPGTVATLYKIDTNGLIRESELDIAGENFWGISRVFSR